MNIWTTIAAILYVIPVFWFLSIFDDVCFDVNEAMDEGQLPDLPGAIKFIAVILIMLWPIAMTLEIIMAEKK
jgi:hypothetical protein